MRVEEGFQPIPFVEGHPFTTDPVLPGLLKRIFPSSVLTDVAPDLIRFGGEVTTSIRTLASRAEPPHLTQYNQWGQRVDTLHTSEGWRALKEVSQREGIPGIFYERKYGEHSRVYGFAKILLMTGDSQTVFCPMSMTDGTARVVELFGTPEMKRVILPRLISRDPSVAFTAGQWMTERSGGSDVSQTETIATLTNPHYELGPQFKLDGFKWFSSATDSDIAVALARTGSVTGGSRSLSLFLIPLRLPFMGAPYLSPTAARSNNGILIHRLKQKIGTHPLPTAELSLNDTEAYLVGSINRGVKNITPVLNITRIHSAFASIGHLRKCLAIASSYATVRAIKAGQQLLKDNPVHVAQLASINLVYRALAHLAFGAARLLGKIECGVASAEEQHRLRILTPIVKAFSAEKACAAMEEAMTALGGAGYMEENEIGRDIRDGLVEKIWEGTTTVLSLDLVRAAQDPSTAKSFLVWGKAVILSCPKDLESRLNEPLGVLTVGLELLAAIFNTPIATLMPRPALFLTAYAASSLYLLEHAIWSHGNGELERDTDIEVFRRWVVEGGLVEAIEDVRRTRGQTEERVSVDSVLVYGVSSRTKL